MITTSSTTCSSRRVAAGLLVAAVVPGPVAEQIELLATSEDDFTRWAEVFDAPDPDSAAALAYEHCRRWDDEV
ncbi:hypothetical protein J7E87_32150 [Streptomyces sp. ISL-1]|uniref:hypothetical protein n=1 Tax=Streptomyces sp. ISL-1 TaxID=2817657 RepID=UPI001BEB689F|nr:hypothetical protein [Streptomyces sp. ISL-1]MBT2393939.1 hypothetical protein [Streptomyces sp. ISL-1]